jgi:hypothetical protein
MKKKLTVAAIIVRLFMTIFLLYTIARHAHWSVAVFAWLVAIDSELAGFTTHVTRMRIEKLELRRTLCVLRDALHSGS